MQLTSIFPFASRPSKELAEIPAEEDAPELGPNEAKGSAPEPGYQNPTPVQNSDPGGGSPLLPPSVATSEMEKEMTTPSPSRPTAVTPTPPESPSENQGVLRAQLLDAARARLPETPKPKVIDLTSPLLTRLQQSLPEIQTILTEGLDPLRQLVDSLNQGKMKLREVCLYPSFL